MAKIFLSYAREDEDIALQLYRDLIKNGYKPWMDKEDLLPGVHWKSEIRRVIKESAIFIALLSDRSINKRGYFQKELRHAIDALQEIPESKIFLIPARLDDCTPTDPLIEEINRVDLFPSYERGLKKILAALRGNIGDARRSTLATAGPMPSARIESVLAGRSPRMVDLEQETGSSRPAKHSPLAEVVERAASVEGSGTWWWQQKNLKNLMFGGIALSVIAVVLTYLNLGRAASIEDSIDRTSNEMTDGNFKEILEFVNSLSFKALELYQKDDPIALIAGIEAFRIAQEQGGNIGMYEVEAPLRELVASESIAANEEGSANEGAIFRKPNSVYSISPGGRWLVARNIKREGYTGQYVAQGELEFSMLDESFWARHGQLELEYERHTPRDFFVFSPNDRWLITRESTRGNERLQLWDMNSQDIAPVTIHEDSKNRWSLLNMAITSRGDLLAHIISNDEIELWSIQDLGLSQRPIILRNIGQNTCNRPNLFSFTGDGSRLICAAGYGSFVLWKRSSQSYLLENHRLNLPGTLYYFRPEPFPFKMDEYMKQELVVIEDDNLLGVNLVVARRSLVAFSRDSRWLAVSEDNSIRLYDQRREGRQSVMLRNDGGPIRELAFSSLGEWFVTIDQKRIQRRFTSIEAVIDAACSLSGRNLTHQEWSELIGDDPEYRKTCDKLP